MKRWKREEIAKREMERQKISERKERREKERIRSLQARGSSEPHLMTCLEPLKERGREIERGKVDRCQGEKKGREGKKHRKGEKVERAGEKKREVMRGKQTVVVALFRLPVTAMTVGAT